MITTHCPDHDTLFAYSVGRLNDEQSDEVASHLSSCPDCQAEIQTLDDRADTLMDDLRGAVEDSCLEEPQLAAAVAKVLASPERAERSETSAVLGASSRSLGEYRLLEELGRGGMGRVYLALHTKLDRVVALKVLPKSRLEVPHAMARFEREMRAIGQLKHPNIVHAYDAREIDGQPVLIMEYIDGVDLAEVVRRLGRLGVADACELARQAAMGLQYAHQHGLVHRDIKPSNLMLSREGEVKLLDLGLARLRAELPSGAEMTDTGQAMGTADYMAPEQASDSRTVDIRADLYSLGCTLYKLLAGRAPFADAEHRGTFDKMTAHVREPIPPIHLFAPDVPDALRSILERLLAKRPEDRFAMPAEAAAALAPFCAGADLASLAVRAAEASTDDQGSSQLVYGSWKSEPAAPVTPSTLPRRRRPWIVLTAIGVVLLGSLGGFFLGVVVTIKKNGQETRVEVPDKSTTRVDADGNVTVTLSGQTQTPPPTGQAIAPPIPAIPVVDVCQPIIRQISDHEDFTGTVEAIQSVGIRARIAGKVDKVHFKAGMMVKQGDPLLEIDPRPFEADAAKWAADVQRLQTQLKEQSADLDKAKADPQQIEKRATAEALLKSAQKELELAQTRLASTRLTAPISGRISRPLVSVGSLVTADNTVLATIDSVDPMVVSFAVPQETVLQLRRATGTGMAAPDAKAPWQVLCGLGNGDDLPYRGTVESMDSQIDPKTSTATWRATIPNPDGTLMPGMFARVRLVTSEPHDVLLVPETALKREHGEVFALVVTDRNIVERRPIILGKRQYDLFIVKVGLKDNDWVIVSSPRGAELAPGMSVQPKKRVAEIGRDEQLLQGTWVVVSYQPGWREGSPGSETTTGTITLRKDRVSVALDTSGRKTSLEGTFAIDSTRHPKTIDFTLEKAGRALGIYEFKNGRLRIMLNESPGGDRPTAFVPDRNAPSHLLMVLRRFEDDSEADEREGAASHRQLPPVAAIQPPPAAMRIGAVPQNVTIDEQLIQGNWQIVSAQDGGRDVRRGKYFGVRLSLKDGKLRLAASEPGRAEVIAGGYCIDPTQTPKTIDLDFGQGMMPGIYELDGDRLQIVFNEIYEKSTNLGRPTKFTSEPNSPNDVFMVLVRIKQSDGAEQRPAPHVDPAQELQAIQGTWNVAQVERGSAVNWETSVPGWPKELALGQIGTVAIDSQAGLSRIAFLDFKKGLQARFKLIIEPAESPKRCDLLGGPWWTDDQQTVAQGIYKTEGRELTLCLAQYLPSVRTYSQRPAGFSIEPSTVLFKLVRHQPSGDEATLVAGPWELQAATFNGQEATEKARNGAVLTFAQSSYKMDNLLQTDLALAGGFFALNPAATPKAIDLIPPLRREQGRVRYPGIYSLEGDRLRIAYHPGEPRPTKFESSPGSDVTLLELKRKKQENASPEPAKPAAGATGNNAPQRSPTSSRAGYPSIAERVRLGVTDWPKELFQTARHDFGTVARHAKAEYRFVLANGFAEDVHIKSISSTSPGCFAAKATDTLVKSTSSAEIVVTLDTDRFVGRRSAHIAIEIDAPSPAQAVLELTAYIADDAANPSKSPPAAIPH